MSAPELKPCPFCGNTSPFTYITFSCAVLECKCGATLKKCAAQVMYKKDELPEALKPYAYEAELLVIRNADGSETAWPDHGYIGVNVMGAFAHAGITEHWNRRVTEGAEP